MIGLTATFGVMHDAATQISESSCRCATLRQTWLRAGRASDIDPQATAARATWRQAIPGHRFTLRSRVPAIVADDEGQPTWHRPRPSTFRRVERRSSFLWQRIILPARLSTSSPTWDLMDARIAVRRWSPDMRSWRVAASPFFQRVATSYAAQRRRNTLHRFYVPSHPPSWDGCYPDWSSQAAFLAR